MTEAGVAGNQSVPRRSRASQGWSRRCSAILWDAASSVALGLPTTTAYFEASALKGDKLQALLRDRLGGHPNVGDIRGRGLMVGIELVADKATRQRWPVEAERGRRAAAEARDRGLLTRGLLNDILCLAPPFTASEETMGRAVEILGESIVATEDPHL